MDGTSGLVWHNNRCVRVGTFRRWHQVALIVIANATGESKHAVGFVYSTINRALQHKFKLH